MSNGGKYRASHHRVDATLYARSLEKVRNAGQSMSTLATIGLQDYVAHADESTQAQALKRLENGFDQSRSVELPKEIVGYLNKMQASQDENLTSYLKALHQVGWSYASLAKPLGITRQGVHLRLGRGDKKVNPIIPPVVSGPGRTSFPSQSTQPISRFDWSIWVESNLYALVVEQARQSHEQLAQVMEVILRRYLADDLTLPAGVSGKIRRRNSSRTALKSTTKNKEKASIK